eukprot:1192216-Prorocentrum_minimum.AAC.3
MSNSIIPTRRDTRCIEWRHLQASKLHHNTDYKVIEGGVHERIGTLQMAVHGYSQCAHSDWRSFHRPLTAEQIRLQIRVHGEADPRVEEAPPHTVTPPLQSPFTPTTKSPLRPPYAGLTPPHIVRRRGPRQGWSTGHKAPRWAAGRTGLPRPIACVRAIARHHIIVKPPLLSSPPYCHPLASGRDDLRRREGGRLTCTGRGKPVWTTLGQ